MLRLITFLIILVASVWLGLAVFQHPGYLLLSYQPWLVQMPIWFALIGFIIFCMLFYLLISGIDSVHFLFFRMKNWLRIRREHKAYSKTQHGLTLLIEGRWYKAERLLISGVNQSFEPLMNYVGAAYAADQQNALDRRDQYIQKAYQVAPNADLAIGLTQADMQLSHDQLEQAVATLTHLRQANPRHPRVLKLLERVYVRLADWKNLEALMPYLRKAKVLTPENADHFEKHLYCEIFQSANHKDLIAVQAIWDDLPRAAKKDPEVITAYVKQLHRFGETTTIADLIRKVLKSTWQPELVNIYGTLPMTNLNRELVLVGAWLKTYGQKPELLLLLGKLCRELQLWGKAKDYFTKCLALGPNAEASLEYGKLLESLGEESAAIVEYREGLARLTS